jgi:hypothetical protein
LVSDHCPNESYAKTYHPVCHRGHCIGVFRRNPVF